jgi:hypothetical protein
MPAAFERDRTNVWKVGDNFSRLHCAAAKTVLKNKRNSRAATIRDGKSHPVMMKILHRHDP